MARRGKKESNDDVLKTYFDEIRATPLLSFEEELELSRRIMQGDEEARQKLIKANLRLVVKIARSFASSDIPLMDLIQEGNLGLIRAAQKYDFKKNVRFSTYASWWIKQAISRALVNKRRSIRLPHRKEEALKKIQRAYNALSQELMREPTAEELAREVHMAPEEVDQILSLSNTMVSLDAETGKDDTTSLLELYEDRTYCPDVEFLRNSVREDTLRFLEKLMERERKILMYRFEFFGGEKYTLKQIGDEMGLSPETVRQIELRALKKFKENAAELKEYMQFSYC
ncbi:RNA polymerase sigma factor RpoD/SigA [Treponema sp. J25]|uniref:sigma-70 family RNA polymerase sigma factor n=1 Tax=Treponema sp. J25 TaxID=2094121 RepID=UPI00104D8BFB|nr:RNA polymerase sigma factor RpoD/SigA [Treponema sp. J25]TCW60409.1 RNA polymerase subunit sigma-70 [Treponema sp. J25]